MKKVQLATDILGAYTLERIGNYSVAEDLFISTGRMDEYLPLLNLIKFNHEETVKLTDGKQIKNDVVSHTSYMNNRSFSPAVMETTKLTIDQNDILGSKVVINMNLTSKHVTVSEPDGVKKLYHPLGNKKFTSLNGHLVIFTVYYFNHPRYMNTIKPCPNYFKLEAERLEYVTEPRTKITRDIYTYLANNPGLFKEDPMIQPESTVRVVTISTISEAMLTESDVENTLTGNTYSVEEYYKVANNPHINKPLFKDFSVFEEMSPSEICVYINDPNLETKPYFISIAGKVHRIAKIKDATTKPGLYIVVKTEEGILDYITEPLESLPDSKYVYGSREEAVTGADRRGNFSRELEELKELNKKKELERKEQMDRLTYEHDLEMVAIRKENETFKLELEKQRAIMSNENENLKNNRTIESTNAKKSFEEYMYEANRYTTASKSNYEIDKYRRDSTLETIKTVGSVVAAGAGIVFLYSKFAK